MRVFCTILLTFILLNCWAQYNLKGKVCNVDMSCIANCHIYSSTGNFSLSDENGEFEIKAKTNDTLFFSHIGYFERQIVIKNHQYLNVFLAIKRYDIGEIDVLSKAKAHRITRKNEYILDFCFKKDTLFLLKQYNSVKLKQEIVACRGSDTVSRKGLKYKYLGFEISPSGTIYCYNKDSIFELTLTENEIQLKNPQDINEFKDILYWYCGKINSSVFTMKPEFKNSVIKFFLYNTLNEEYTLMSEVVDSQSYDWIYREMKETIKQNRHLPPELIVNSYKEMRGERFEEYLLPSTKILNGNFYIISFLKNYFEKYNSEGELVAKTSMSANKNLKEIKTINEYPESNNIYFAGYNKNGLTELRYINVKTGEVREVGIIPDYKFVEGITINNGVVWFLFNGYKSSWTKSLYNIKLSNI